MRTQEHAQTTDLQMSTCSARSCAVCQAFARTFTHAGKFFSTYFRPSSSMSVKSRTVVANRARRHAFSPTTYRGRLQKHCQLVFCTMQLHCNKSSARLEARVSEPCALDLQLSSL